MNDAFYSEEYLEEEPMLEMYPGRNINIYGEILRGRILTLKFQSLFSQRPESIYVETFDSVSVRLLSNSYYIYRHFDKKIAGGYRLQSISPMYSDTHTFRSDSKFTCIPLLAPPSNDDTEEGSSYYNWIIEEGWV